MKNVVFELTFSLLQFGSISETHQRKQSWRIRTYFTDCSTDTLDI